MKEQKMTEIEEEFFKAFNIAKTSFDFTCHCNKKRLLGRFACLECDNEAKKEINVYPKITDRILLEMICIVTRYMNEICQFDSVDELKKATLEELIMLVEDDNFHEKCYEDVQSLFERGAEDGRN